MTARELGNALLALPQDRLDKPVFSTCDWDYVHEVEAREDQSCDPPVETMLS
jgi:hypothetical protein